MPAVVAGAVGEAMLAEAVAAPLMMDVAATALPSALFGTAAEGALANGLGASGISGLFGTAAQGALANGLAGIAPETAAQLSAVSSSALPGASQLAPLTAAPAPTAQVVQNVLAEQETAQAAQALQAQQAANAAQQAQSLTLRPPVVEPPVDLGVGPVPTNAPISLKPSSGGLRDLVEQSFGSAKKWIEDNPKTAAASAGLAGYTMGKSGSQQPPTQQPYTGPLSQFRYDPSRYTPYTPQPPVNPYMARYAEGGPADLGGYSDGGRMLKGPGDGMSDDIPATIANKQPARLANEEFVIPADVVSHLGNGSSEAGAKQLYKMMDRVRQARTGNKKQGKQINPEKYLA